MIGRSGFEAVAAALGETGFRPRDIRCLSVRPAAMAPRASYRVGLACGATVKVRRMESGEAARQQQHRRAGLPPGFTRVLARAGAFLIEEWIDGRPLTDAAPAAPLLDQAGRLLAALHAVAAPGEPQGPTVAGWADATRARLGTLREAGVLDAATTATLIAIVTADTPGAEPAHRLVHTDVCGENLVVTPQGHLYAVDNEHMAIDAPGLDLGRSWYRWGLGDADWVRVRTAYRTAGGPDDAVAHEPFWRIAGTAISACIRLRGSRTGLAVPLDRLRELACPHARREQPWA